MTGRETNLLGILNLSLAHLGEDEVLSFESPDSEAGIKLKRFIYQSIDEVQSNYLWQELLSTKTLTADTTDYYDGRNRFPLPDDCLRPLGLRLTSTTVSHPYITFNQPEYLVEGDYIITSADDADLFYIKRDDDPVNWTSELQRCVAMSAAIDAAYLITDEAGITKNLIQKFEQITLPRAKLLQSKYKRNRGKGMPEGFSNLYARIR